MELHDFPVGNWTRSRLPDYQEQAGADSPAAPRPEPPAPEPPASGKALDLLRKILFLRD